MKRKHSEMGMTLLEITIASAIFVVILMATLFAMNQMASFANLENQEQIMERELQSHLDTIVLDLKESSPSKMSYYDFQLNDPETRWQTAICFATARDQSNDEFQFMNSSGSVQLQPIWQGIIIYSVYYEPATEKYWLTKYAHYDTSIDYDTQMPDIVSHTDTTFTLSNGVVIDRSAKTGESGDERVIRLSGDIRQLVRSPQPPDVAIYPLALMLVAEQELIELSGDTLTVSSSTSVLARNNN